MSKKYTTDDIEIVGKLIDANDSSGTSGQILSSTATGVDWIDPSEIDGVTGSGTENYIPKWSDADTLSVSVIYDDGTNVGIGTINPSQRAVISGPSTAPSFNTTAPSSATLLLSNSDTGYGTYFGSNSSGTGLIQQRRQTSAVYYDLALNPYGGNVGIGTTSPLKPLQVDGIIAAQRSGVEGVYARRELTGSGHELDVPSGYHSLLVKNNGSEQLRITSTGNVGIGTTSPESVLHVSGGSTTIPTLSGSHPFTISNTANSGMSIISGTDNAGQIVFGDGSDADVGRLRYQHSDDSMRFWTNASEKMRITSTGDVGIGTTIPSFGTGGGLQITNATQANLRFTDTSDSTFITDLALSNDDFYIINRAASGQLKFRVNASTEAMTILSTGNVGIGTTSPSAKLEVAGDVLIDSGEYLSWGTAGATSIEGSTASNKLQFRTSSTDRMIINDTGVGIGTTSPVAKLHVYQNDTEVDTAAGVTIEQDGTGDAALSFLLSGTKRWRMGIDNSDADKFKISSSTNLASDNKLTIDSSGQVGIGTTSPGEKLEVDGNILATGTVLGSNLSGTNTGDQTLPTASSLGAVTLSGTQTITGVKTFSNASNHYNGHFIYDSFDDAGNHYPHFQDGSDNGGTTVNWRQYYGSNYKNHTWTSDASGNMGFTFQGSIHANGGNVTGSNLSGTNTGDQDISDMADNTTARHTHANKSVLDSFGDDGSGNPTYNGVAIDVTIAQRDVYDGLDSTDGTISLAASQGKTLKDVQDTQQDEIDLNTDKISFDATSSARLSNTSGTNTGDQDLSSYLTSANLNGYLLNTTDTLTGDLTVTGDVSATDGTFSSLNISASIPSLSFTDLQQDDWDIINDNGEFKFRNTSGIVDVLTLASSGAATFASSVSATDGLFSGDIGIGITPTSKLHLSEAGGVTIKLGTSNNTSQIEAREVSSGQSLILSASNNVDHLTINDIGAATFSSSVSAVGNVTGSNLSGINTGDQDLSGYLLNTTDTLTGNLSVTGQVSGTTGSFSNGLATNYGLSLTNGSTDFLLYNNASENLLYMRDITNGAMITTWGVNTFTVNKNLKVTGTSAFTGNATFTGSVTSGGVTLTGDQTDITGTAAYASKLEAGGPGPNAEDLNTVADNVTVGQLEYRGFNSSSTNGPNVSDNANGVITVGQHSGAYNAQLAFSSDGNMYWRDNPGTSYGSWKTMWDSGNLTNVSQLNNDSAYLTSYVDTNTTYTAGNGLELSGTTFKVNGGLIPGSIDLDDYDETGYYTQNSDSNANSGDNYPVNKAGVLTVIVANGNTVHKTQTYDQYNSSAFYNRSYYNGTWSTWRNLAQDTNTDTVYTHPSYNGDDMSVDTGALGGAVVISDLDFNLTSDGAGHVVDANATVATRTLTLANLGFTGATNANYITNNNQLTNSAGYITSAGNTNTQLTAEQVEDIIGAAWVSGTNNTFVYDDANGTLKINSTNTQRGIDQVPVENEFAESISSNWAFDNVKTAVPANAVFTDTVNTFDGAYSSLSGTPTIPSGNSIVDWTTDQGSTNIHVNNYQRREISDTPTDGYSNIAISSNWAFDNVKTAVPAGALFTDTNTQNTYVASDFSHDSLSGVDANEHLDWTTDRGATNIHANNYANDNTQLSSAQITAMGFSTTDNDTTYSSSDFTHDSLSGVSANEHIDWTANQGSTNIHAGNFDTSGFLLNTTDTLSGALTVTGTLYANTGVNLKDGEHVIFDSDNDNYAKIGTDSNDDMLYESANSHVFKNGEDDSFETVKAGQFIKDGGTSSQFLKADGSSDSNTYLTSSSTQSKYARSDEDDAIAGTYTYTNSIPFITKLSGYKSMVMHHVSSNDFVFAPSASINATDWNWGLQTSFDLDNGDMSVAGNVTADDFILSSDIRLKKDLLPLHSRRLSPKRWTWKESCKKDFGFIAQELEVDFPEAVVTGKDGYKKISYGKVTAINAARINELQDENKRLSNKVDDLEAKLKLIMKKLDI